MSHHHRQSAEPAQTVTARANPRRTNALRSALLLTLGLTAMTSIVSCASDNARLTSAINGAYHTDFSSQPGVDQLSSAK